MSKCLICGNELPKKLPKFPKIYNLDQERKDEIMAARVHVACCAGSPWKLVAFYKARIAKAERKLWRMLKKKRKRPPN